MINCKICNAEFNNMISWRHLKTHGLTCAEYKKIHGDVVSDEFKELKRLQNTGENNPNYGKNYQWSVEQCDKLKGRKAPNKGVPMSEQQKKQLSELALKRNSDFNETGSHPLVGRKLSNETKTKISIARKKQEISPEQIDKAIETKRKNGYDLGFFRGKTHSNESKQKISEKSKISSKIKSEKAKADRNNRIEKYGYSIVNDSGLSVELSCPFGHTFSRTRQYLTLSKFNSEMCPVCFPPLSGTSKAEDEIYKFISQYTLAIRGDRSKITPKELDIFLPEFNIAIEYNGLYWHSELYKDSKYHKEKLNLCMNKGIRLIQIFEDEWISKTDIVKARLLSFILQNTKIAARKCVVKTISPELSNKFINTYHIQGTGRATIHIGLFFNNELLSVMTFLNGDISKGVKGWELNRFCTKSGNNIIGGASKLFKFFISKYNPDSILSFADLRWCATSPVYETLGFTRMNDTPPNYWYFKTNEISRHHRYGLRKPHGCTTSERELRNAEGWIRIYDAGNAKFIWTKKHL